MPQVLGVVQVNLAWACENLKTSVAVTVLDARHNSVKADVFIKNDFIVYSVILRFLGRSLAVLPVAR